MKEEKNFDFGMIGLGVMGRNLLLNMADHGFSVAGHDQDPEKVRILKESGKGKAIDATTGPGEFIAMLKIPRTIILLVPAGAVVQQVINELVPHLQEKDLIIDGGNSLFSDTEKRITELQQKGLWFMGTGISGGEEGARLGPSIMPGGSEEAYKRIQAVFEAISAKVNGEPCVAYIGKGGAGHYVKMIHNGIEYSIMQMIAEAYDLLKRAGGLNNNELHEVFTEWNTTELNSFLIEITGLIFNKMDEGGKKWLVDEISDAAGQKGTGMWTTENAMELQVPVPSIDMAVAMRDLSKYKDDRKAVVKLVRHEISPLKQEKQEFIEMVRKALYCSILIAYAQGFLLMEEGSAKYKYGISLSTVAKIWRGGCIIRAKILDDISRIFNENESGNLLLDQSYTEKISVCQDDLRNLVCKAAGSGIPAPAMMASLAYLDAFRSELLPTNLIQAQRDFFGSHTYQRIDKNGIFHTQWT